MSLEPGTTLYFKIAGHVLTIGTPEHIDLEAYSSIQKKDLIGLEEAKSKLSKVEGHLRELTSRVLWLKKQARGKGAQKTLAEIEDILAHLSLSSQAAKV